MQKQGGQHHTPGQHRMQRPGTGQRTVVHRRNDQRQQDAQRAGNELYRCFVDGPQLVMPNRNQCYHAECRTRRAQRQKYSVDLPQIAACQLQQWPATFHFCFSCSQYSTLPCAMVLVPARITDYYTAFLCNMPRFAAFYGAPHKNILQSRLDVV